LPKDDLGLRLEGSGGAVLENEDERRGAEHGRDGDARRGR
jgi:hypothetical protein